MIAGYFFVLAAYLPPAETKLNNILIPTTHPLALFERWNEPTKPEDLC